MYVLALFLALNNEIFPFLLDDRTLGTILGWLVVIFCLASPIYYLVVVHLGSKSYCDVYENMVVGTTCLSRKNPMQNFQLDYGQIVNVTEGGKNITIYTPYGHYVVLAQKNRTEAIRAIRDRMAALKR